MLSKTERKYLIDRLNHGTPYTYNNKDTIVLPSDYYSRDYQKVMNYRIRKKTESMINDLAIILPHFDLWLKPAEGSYMNVDMWAILQLRCTTIVRKLYPNYLKKGNML